MSAAHDPDHVLNEHISALLAERAELKAELFEVTVQLETARQMLRTAMNVDIQIHGQRTA